VKNGSLPSLLSERTMLHAEDFGVEPDYTVGVPEEAIDDGSGASPASRSWLASFAIDSAGAARPIYSACPRKQTFASDRLYFSYGPQEVVSLMVV
jgi:hypothetical protein